MRCLAGQCAGRLAQTLSGSPTGGAEGAVMALADSFCRQLQAGRGVSQRTGLCMALGALYRARGGIMGGGGHYGNVLPVLLALAQDQASSDVQVFKSLLKFLNPIFFHIFSNKKLIFIYRSGLYTLYL